MKKIALTLLCASIAAPAFAAGSYVTGNVKGNTERDTEYTLEAGHTFSTGTTLLVEVAGSLHDGVRSVTDTTFGIEQMAYTNGGLWTAVGYHNLSLDGSVSDSFDENGDVVETSTSGQHRPLVKSGYNFDNGVFVSNRTRFHYDINASDWAQIRYDNAVGYNMENGIQLKLNVVYNQDITSGDTRDSYNTEWRVTKNDFMGTGIAPYFELRDEDMGENLAGKDNDRNLAFTFGASYGF